MVLVHSKDCVKIYNVTLSVFTCNIVFKIKGI